MNYFKISVIIFFSLAITRFLPHPPNFTSLVALSFYVPAILGIWYTFPVVSSFFITDLFIGFHGLVLFTWGSVILVGLVSNYFHKYFYSRIMGTFLSCLIFYLVTNYGVWLNGSYEYSLKGLLNCYFMAIPFFKNTILSTLFFSIILEIFIYIFKKKYSPKKV